MTFLLATATLIAFRVYLSPFFGPPPRLVYVATAAALLTAAEKPGWFLAGCVVMGVAVVAVEALR